MTRPRNGIEPFFTTLAFGMSDAARALAQRRAHIDLPAAAGLGRLNEAGHLLSSEDSEARHRARSLAVQHGQAEIIRLLLDASEDPTCFNSKATIRTRGRSTRPSRAATRWWSVSWCRHGPAWLSVCGRLAPRGRPGGPGDP